MLAIGVAAVVFWGFVPLVGLKTLLALGCARLLRGSMVAAVITVTLHDVLLPVAPLLLRWEYDLGYWLLSHPHAFPPSLQLNRHGRALLEFTLQRVKRPGTRKKPNSNAMRSQPGRQAWRGGLDA